MFLRKIKKEQIKGCESNPQIMFRSIAIRWFSLHTDGQGRALWALCEELEPEEQSPTADWWYPTH